LSQNAIKLRLKLIKEFLKLFSGQIPQLLLGLIEGNGNCSGFLLRRLAKVFIELELQLLGSSSKSITLT
jgi:hypothetical protein